MNNSTCVKSSKLHPLSQNYMLGFRVAQTSRAASAFAGAHSSLRAERKDGAEPDTPRCPAGGSQNSMPIGKSPERDGFLDCRFIIRNHFSTRVCLRRKVCLSKARTSPCATGPDRHPNARYHWIGRAQGSVLPHAVETHNPYKPAVNRMACARAGCQATCDEPSDLGHCSPDRRPSIGPREGICCLGHRSACCAVLWIWTRAKKPPQGLLSETSAGLRHPTRTEPDYAYRATRSGHGS